jgi:CRP-like cAMP-binding protein
MNPVIALLNSIYSLTPHLQEQMNAILKEKVFQKKEYLLKAGHVCRNIFFMKEGLVRCFNHNKDKEVCTWFMKEGDLIISVQSFYRQRESKENIQALEDCEVYMVDHFELQNLYNSYLEYNFIGRILTEKYYLLCDERLQVLHLANAHDRYQYLLENHNELVQRVPSKYLASYLGVTEQSLSRIKKARNNKN